eukprot:SAG11_NODE_6135_length_1381_cov_1.776911_1_plen_152_part_01
MAPDETLRLSPWQKWREYKRFPWKFLLQLVLLLLVTVQATFHANTTLPYFNRSAARIADAFFGYIDPTTQQRVVAKPCGGDCATIELDSIGQFEASLSSTISSYASFVERSIDGYATVPPHPTVVGATTCGPPPKYGEAPGATAAAQAEMLC